MTYELAKKLKDAGFPQLRYKGKGKIFPLRNEDGTLAGKDTVYIPTLSELIEACGFGIIISYDADKCIAAKDGLIVEGETPEEAVANLWLKLNKK